MASMMSMPLSCTCEEESTCCGRASATIRQASEAYISAGEPGASRLTGVGAREGRVGSGRTYCTAASRPKRPAQDGDKRNEQQQKKGPGMGKLKVAHAGAPSRGRVALTNETARCCNLLELLTCRLVMGKFHEIRTPREIRAKGQNERPSGAFASICIWRRNSSVAAAGRGRLKPLAEVGPHGLGNEDGVGFGVLLVEQGAGAFQFFHARAS